jgi:cytoskeletal protein CcmA (bactofilin family)
MKANAGSTTESENAASTSGHGYRGLPFETKHGRVVVLTLVVAIVLVPMAGVATGGPAQQVSGTVVVEQDETVDSIDAVTGTIIVRGTVTGDVSGAAGEVHVTETGTVDGSVSTAGEKVRIDGEVDGDVSGGSESLEVTETARIGGDVEGGTAHLLIDGRVDGDVRVGADRVELGPNASVGGEFRYDADEFTRDPGATVEGGVVHDRSLRRDCTLPINDCAPAVGAFAAPTWLGAGYALLANLLLGAVLLVVVPEFSSGIASRVAEDPVRTGGAGLLALFGVPLVLVLFALTVVGLPIAVLGAIGFGFAVWVGAIYGQYAVGTWVLRRAGRENQWLALVAGVLGFTVLGAIPVIGTVLGMSALLLGLGALALGLWEAYRARRGQRRRGQQTTLDGCFEAI